MIRIIADSSCDLVSDPSAGLHIVPMTIIVGSLEYVDDEAMDSGRMLQDLEQHTGKTSTACPAPGAWLDAMEGADEVLIATITGHLSGTYNGAVAAGELYRQANPQARVCVIDSLSTGPELALVVQKAQELAQAGLDFDTVCRKTAAYSKTTRLFFTLQSLRNMAQNGRVSKLVAAAVGVLGIRIVGTASAEGELAPLQKVKGDRKAVAAMIEQLAAAGYQGGLLRLTHIQAPHLAELYRTAILNAFPHARITVAPSTGLCSYYAERNGIMIGIETAASQAV